MRIQVRSFLTCFLIRCIKEITNSLTCLCRNVPASRCKRLCSNTYCCKCWCHQGKGTNHSLWWNGTKCLRVNAHTSTYTYPGSSIECWRSNFPLVNPNPICPVYSSMAVGKVKSFVLSFNFAMQDLGAPASARIRTGDGVTGIQFAVNRHLTRETLKS